MLVKQILTINHHRIVVWCRKDTKDERVVEEVLKTPCYEKKSIGFRVEENEYWMDIGAHIGCFSLFCTSRGAEAHAYEPESRNFELLERNLTLTTCNQTRATVSHLPDRSLMLLAPTRKREGKIPNTKYSLFPMETYEKRETVLNYQFGPDLTEPFHGIKMDIEGEEHFILENILNQPPAPMVQKMVIEYHFIKDRSLRRFHSRIKKLRKLFKVVSYPAHLDRFIKEGKAEYPGYFDRLIHCIGRK